MTLLVAGAACLLAGGCLPDTFHNGFFTGPEEKVEEEGLSEVEHWWIEDSCNEFHAAWQDAETTTCYIAQTMDPYGAWGEASEVAVDCEEIDIYADHGTGCSIHIELLLNHLPDPDPGPVSYARWDGDAVVDHYELVYEGYTPDMVLDDADQPHFFWSFTDAYHQSRIHADQWNDPTYMATWGPGQHSAWNPLAAIDGAGVWRGLFNRSWPPPDSYAQLYTVASYDYGLNWDEQTQLFPDWEDAGWFTYVVHIFASNRIDNMVVLFRSNRDEEDLETDWDFWYMETTGGGVWQEPERYRPVSEDLRVYVRDGAVEPVTGERTIIAMSERDDPKEFYYQWRCIGGESTSALPWPKASEDDVVEEVKVLWRRGDRPRLYWRLQDSTSWHTTSRIPPACS